MIDFKNCPLTDRAVQALVQADKRVKSIIFGGYTRTSKIGSIDLLYGLALDTASVAGHVIRHFGLRATHLPGNVQEEWEKQDVFGLVEHAFGLSEMLGHNHIGPEHLLLALVTAECHARRWLVDCSNVSPDGIEAMVLELLGKPEFSKFYLPPPKFWEHHCQQWLTEASLGDHQWTFGFAPKALFSVKHKTMNFGVSFETPSEDGSEESFYVDEGGVQTQVFRCQTESVGLAHTLAVSYLTCRLQFPNLDGTPAKVKSAAQAARMVIGNKVADHDIEAFLTSEIKHWGGVE